MDGHDFARCRQVLNLLELIKRTSGATKNTFLISSCWENTSVRVKSKDVLEARGDLDDVWEARDLGWHGNGSTSDPKLAVPIPAPNVDRAILLDSNWVETKEVYRSEAATVLQLRRQIHSLSMFAYISDLTVTVYTPCVNLTGRRAGSCLRFFTFLFLLFFYLLNSSYSFWERLSHEVLLLLLSCNR